MRFPLPLVPARLVQRYKRFLFDAVLEETGEAITGSCPNTGSMLGLTTPGSRIWLSEHDSPTRKYRHMFEMIETENGLVGVNTGLPNRLAQEAVEKGLIRDLGDYPLIERERKYGRNSRIDLLLSGPGRKTAYVEVKNVHFSRRPGLAEFPDTATKRGTKHLDELAEMTRQGHRAIMLYLVQREDCTRFALCSDLDPVYGAAFARARDAGVEAYAVRCRVDPCEITPLGLIAMDEAPPAAL